MILPSKHISEEQALLGVGAVLLRNLDQPQTVTSLWDRVRDDRSIGTYERFVLALDLLHIMGVINLSQGILKREVP
ncbi:ABC-three component system middle component 6 [Methanoculleus sp.]|uniref:ABC-three component system middle component 6 n=1 Tax=Methanoculleus sp. TaxID=90427 RepID=UPI00345BCFA1